MIRLTIRAKLLGQPVEIPGFLIDDGGVPKGCTLMTLRIRDGG